MTRKESNFVLIVGFLMVFGAVGGIENDGPLLDGMLIAVVGLLMMGAGVLGMKVLDSRGE
jgi:hypothetical protein